MVKRVVCAIPNVQLIESEDDLTYQLFVQYEIRITGGSSSEVKVT